MDPGATSVQLLGCQVTRVIHKIGFVSCQSKSAAVVRVAQLENPKVYTRIHIMYLNKSTLKHVHLYE